MIWQIKNFKRYHQNTLQGFFDLQIGPILIKGFTYHLLNGKTWATFPAKPEIKDGVPIYEDGKMKYHQMVSIDKDRLPDFQDWVRNQVDPLLKK